MDSVSDEELVERYRAEIGSPRGDSFINQLFHRHHSRVAAWCLRMTGDANSAADLAQDIFIKAFQRLDSFRGDSKFTTWLYAIARNRCLDELRTRRRRRVVYFSELEFERGEEDVSPLEFIPDSQPLPEEIAERFDLQRTLQRAMFVLSPKSRSIVHLHCSKGLTFSEIGHILKMSVPTVKTYFYRSLPRLRTALMAQEQIT